MRHKSERQKFLKRRTSREKSRENTTELQADKWDFIKKVEYKATNK